MKETLIIAEAGVNHNGDIELAYKLVDAAAEAGADYVKFQTFKASKTGQYQGRESRIPKNQYQRFCRESVRDAKKTGVDPRNA